MIRHLAFIMDGNGRWATAKGLKRVAGHREGVRALKRVLRACLERGISIVSVYAFSTENWKRPKDEIDGIFSLVSEFYDELSRDGGAYKINVCGDIDKLPIALKKSALNVAERTKNNTGMTVNVMLNYGGRAEIARAAASLAAEGLEITEDNINSRLYTGGMPDPDVIVRTGKERRLSNFMSYQSAYSELIFLDVLWPDMTEAEVELIAEEYAKRNRRYGS